MCDSIGILFFVSGRCVVGGDASPLKNEVYFSSVTSDRRTPFTMAWPNFRWSHARGDRATSSASSSHSTTVGQRLSQSQRQTQAAWKLYSCGLRKGSPVYALAQCILNRIPSLAWKDVEPESMPQLSSAPTEVRQEPATLSEMYEDRPRLPRIRSPSVLGAGRGQSWQDDGLEI